MQESATAEAARSGAGGCPVTHAVGPTGCPVSARAAAFDPFGPEYQGDPATSLQWSVEEEPVFWSPILGYWVVTRYDDVKAVFRDNITFSPAVALEKITPTGPEAEAVLKQYEYGMARTLVNEDEPRHMPRRRAVMKPFTPPELVHHEDMVRRLAREAVDAFIDDGHADLVTQMLYTVPLAVGMEFLGIPQDDIDTLKRFSVAHLVNTWGRPTPEEQVAVAHGVGNFWQYSKGVLAKIRENPEGPGWMQYSVRQQEKYPDVITDSYLESIMMAGIVASHETTAHAGANAVRLLLERRDVWERLCADPGLIPNTVEECLRLAGSMAAWRRITTKDTTVGGVPIPKGSRLLCVFAAANRDPRHFEDPEQFDSRRASAGEHLTFGFGAHQCMGKNLARMEIQIFLQELTTRIPHLRLEEQRFSYVPNTSFRGPEHLMVSWDPAQNPERSDPRVLDARIPVTVGEPSKNALSRPVVVDSVETVADGTITIRLSPGEDRALPKWTSGAHIDIDCGLDDDGSTRSRQYSLCGDPAADTYEIAVLEEKDGRGGSTWVHANLVPGAQARIRGPRNHFHLAPTTGALCFVAGGIGITPVLAHADAARAAGLEYHIHYCGRARERMAFTDRLDRDHPGRWTAHISSEGTRLRVPDLFASLAPDDDVYACGPQRLIDELEEVAGEDRLDHVHVEHFTSTLGALDPTKEHAFEIILKDSGQTLTVPNDRTVLEVLRGANIDIESDCEEGLCGSCEAIVLDGEIDHRDVVLGRAERAAGTKMMTCCSRAVHDSLTLEL